MKIKIIATISALITILSATVAYSAQTFMTICAGKTTGADYAIANVIADAITAKEDNFHCLVDAGSSSIANTNLVGTAGVEVAFLQNDVAYWAYNADLMFQGKPLKGLRAVAALYPEDIHFLVKKDSGIASVRDLVGKRVGFGNQAAGIEGDVQSIFETVGLSLEELESANLMSPQVVASRFGNNQIDAAFAAASYPDATAAELITSGDVTLVGFDDETLAKLNETYPYFVTSIIPAGTYEGVSEDVKVPAVMTILATSEEISDKWVYEFLTVLFDNLGAIHDLNANGAKISLEGALDGITIPLHPGAEKFYKEKGLIE